MNKTKIYTTAQSGCGLFRFVTVTYDECLQPVSPYDWQAVRGFPHEGLYRGRTLLLIHVGSPRERDRDRERGRERVARA